MATFSHRSLDSRGVPRDGVLAADSVEAARASLEAQGMRILTLEALDAPPPGSKRDVTGGGAASSVPSGTLPPSRSDAGPPAAASPGHRASSGVALREKTRRQMRWLLPWSRTIPSTALLLSMQQLAVLLRSGVGLIRSVQSLSSQEPCLPLRAAWLAVEDDLVAGCSLSVAFSRRAGLDGSTLVGLVRSGEATGNLPAVIEQFANLAERQVRLQRQFKAALVYPASVMVMAMVLVGAFFTWFFPPFRQLLIGLNVELPAPTRVLLGLHTAVTNPYVVGATVLLFCGFGYMLLDFSRTRDGREILDHYVLRLPLVGPMVTEVNTVSFVATLGTLLTAGVPLRIALDKATDTCGNSEIATCLRTCTGRVEAGMTLSESLADSPAGSVTVRGLLGAGQETGQLAPMLDHVARMMQADVEVRLEALTRLIEPLMVAGLGLVTGTVFISLLLPIYRVLDSLS